MQKGHRSSNKTIGKIQKAEARKHKGYEKRALVKSRKRAPTPEWEWQVDTSVKTEGFGEIPEESTYARAWSTQLCKESRNKRMDIIE